MKYKITVILALFAFAFSSCGTGSGLSLENENLDVNASYALGVMMGSSFAEDGLFPNMDEFIQGLMDTIAGNARMSMEEAMLTFHMAYMALMEAQQGDAMEEEAAFLADNLMRPGITQTESGLQFFVIEQGTGAMPQETDTVLVHYEGRLLDGTVFDSSIARGEPVEFPLQMVIPGWTEGIQLMQVGSTFRFYIPSNLAYGPSGFGPIPGFATLVFDVALIAIIE